MNNIPAQPLAQEAPPVHPAAELAARIDAILAALLLVIGAHQWIIGRFAGPIWTRISRMRRRFAGLLARPLNDTPPPRPEPASQDAAPAEATPTKPPRRHGPPPAYIPRRHGWLVHIVGYQAAAYMSQLDHLLNEPATRDLLAAASPRWTRAVGRPLRTLCRFLHVTPPPQFQTRSTAPAVLPKAPRAAPATPSRPFPPPARTADLTIDGLHMPAGVRFRFRTI